MSKQKILSLFSALCFLFFVFATTSFAQCAPGAQVKNGPCLQVSTAIGPIGTDPSGLVKSVMGILLSLSGGVAILLIVASGYQFAMSRGNPEKVKEARERLTSAIVGLLFIIFSVVLLQFIGVDVLQIPGLSK